MKLSFEMSSSGLGGPGRSSTRSISVDRHYYEYVDDRLSVVTSAGSR